jgi:molecular chaperone DnaK (HSP70)
VYGHGAEGKKRRVLVFDFGGDTVNASQIMVDGANFVVLATTGGADIDHYILTLMAARFKAKHGAHLN